MPSKDVERETVFGGVALFFLVVVGKQFVRSKIEVISQKDHFQANLISRGPCVLPCSIPVASEFPLNHVNDDFFFVNSRT